MTYQQLSEFAQQGGAIYFLLIFLGGCAYAFWPSKRADFERASRLPLDEDVNP